MKNKKLIGKYSLFSIAGSTLGVTSKKLNNWDKVFWKNFSISSQIHGIKKLIAINHYDCGLAKMLNKKKLFLSLIHISSPRDNTTSRMPSSA